MDQCQASLLHKQHKQGVGLVGCGGSNIVNAQTRARRNPRPRARPVQPTANPRRERHAGHNSADIWVANLSAGSGTVGERCPAEDAGDEPLDEHMHIIRFFMWLSGA